MRAITIDMVGSALKKPAQTRVRNPSPKPAAKRAANPTKMPGKSKTDIEAVKEYVKYFGLKISPKPGSEPIIGTKNADWYKVFDSWKQAREFFHRARTDHWDFGHAYPWDVKKNPAPKRATGAPNMPGYGHKKKAPLTHRKGAWTVERDGPAGFGWMADFSDKAEAIEYAHKAADQSGVAVRVVATKR